MRILALTNWAVVLLGLAVTQSANALVLIIIARRVTLVEYGQYLACYGLASLLIILPNAGLDAFLLARGGTDATVIPQLWQSAVWLRRRLLLAWLGVMVLLGFCLPAETYPLTVLVPVTLGLACDSLPLLFYSALRSLNHHKWVTAFQVLTALVLLGGTLAWSFGPGQIVLFSVFRALLSVIIAVVVTLLGQRFWWQPAEVIPACSLLKAAYPFALADAATSIYMKADLIIVSLFLGAVGSSIYGLALSVINMSFLVPNALYFFVLPLLAGSFTADRRRFVQASVAQLGMQALSGVAIATVMFWLAPVTVRQVLGSEYVSSSTVLQVMSPILVLKSLNFGLAAIITAADLQPWRTTAQVVCAFFNIAANLAVVGSLGVWGAVIVYILSEVLLLSGYTWVAHRQCVGRETILTLTRA